MKVLMILTSHDQLGNSGQKTGFWLEEFAAPYFVLRDAGADITLASPKGGQPPIDPKSDAPESQTDATHRLKGDENARAALANTQKLSEINGDEFDAIFYPGGHGPLWDLVKDPHSIALIESFYDAGKPIAAVCHAPAVLLKPRRGDNSPVVMGKAVTGFSNDEEAAVGLSDVVPFLLEDELKAEGGRYTKMNDWQTHTVVDLPLITGQNPASSEDTAKALIQQLK
ncbi:type 1 glutamine amidotransferase domain-containing protein [Motiliproteus sp. SC1-56]|uniref:type 1 glutamine amidotransferase domain-containing protein n=1 Tax=Motiliproteus sp. SC1-56 TaxID=2799565 RepID=UPI001A8D0785|nr:type 1 glutamine amidotransferase domain-containing protein [Motiliproteus sp. SC1-56]